MRVLLKFLTALALLIVVGACPTALILDRTLGQDLLIVVASDAESVEVNRMIWSEGEPVAEIYGTPTGEVARLAFVEEANVLHPEEDPSLALYLKRGDDHPFQVQTFWFFAGRSAAVALFFGLIGAALLWRGRRRAGAGAVIEG